MRVSSNQQINVAWVRSPILPEPSLTPWPAHLLLIIGYISNAISSGPTCLDLRCPLPKCKAAVSNGRVWGDVCVGDVWEMYGWGSGRKSGYVAALASERQCCMHKSTC